MENKFWLNTSIGKKIIVALAGLFLMSFLLVHLVINLLLLYCDQGHLFTVAAHFMNTNIAIKVFEYVLFGGFIIHMLYGVIVTIKNWMSRPVGYHKCNTTTTSFFSKYMIWTGAIIAVFLGIHFMNFFFVKLGFVEPPSGIEKHDFYHQAILLFQNKVYSAIYIVLILTLGFHLNHAFQSAFQTLGLNHNKYTPAIKVFGTLYSIIVAGGFIIIPVYFMFFYN